MTSIASKVKSIANLYVHPIPKGRVTKGRVIYHDRTLVVIDEAGTIYSSAVKGHYHYSASSTALDSTLLALKSARLLSPEALREHMAHAETLRDAEAKKWNARRFLESANEIGVKLTAAQVKKANTLTLAGRG